MSIDKLTKFSEFFEKQAGLFTVPNSALTIPQRQVLQVFCSIALTKCFLIENNIARNRKPNDIISFEDRLFRKNINDIKDICKTYGATANMSLLTNDTNLIITIPLHPENEDKGAKYFKLKDRALDIQIPVHIMVNHSAKNHLTKNLGLLPSNSEWNGLWDGDQHLYLFIDLNYLDDAIQDTEDFITYLAYFRNTFRHEVQHAMQSYVKAYLKLSDFAGMPSKSTREKGFNPFGFPLSQNQPIKELSHSFRDGEFYTDLTDSVQDFKSFISFCNIRIAQSNEYMNRQVLKISPNLSNLLDLVHKLAPQIRSILMKTWMADLSLLAAKRQIHNLISSNIIKPLLSVPSLRPDIIDHLRSSNLNNRFEHIISMPKHNPLFLDFRRHPNGKYQKASIEFYKATKYLLDN